MSMISKSREHKFDFSVQLFACSFLALFLELLLIRWIPSTIRLVAYFVNLMLISSFLGLGLGALVSSRRLRLFSYFPVALIISFGFLYICRNSFLPGSQSELRFFLSSPVLWNYLILIGSFFFNVLIFITIGERIGELFHRLPPLRAYSWDLGGSLAGTVCFGLFSYYAFSPIWGMIIVIVLYMFLTESRHRFINGILLILSLIITFIVTDYRAIWSPYYYITAHNKKGDIIDVSKIPAQLRTMMNPPGYIVRVNQDFYQSNATMDPRRYSPKSIRSKYAKELREIYFFPYFFKPIPQKVLVVGAGGGADVEAGLLNGAKSIDAVEIDPELIKLSKIFNASGVYTKPNVVVYADDARAFLRRSKNKYDLIVFGYLDSQALFSSQSNIRLDGYVYTVESIRTAYKRLREDGMIFLSFYVEGNTWLAAKLFAMIKEATGEMPVCYTDRVSFYFLSFKEKRLSVPNVINKFKRCYFKGLNIPIPTDDWPYLYLSERNIPTDYKVVIIALLILALVGISILVPKVTISRELHFLFLGLGFLLLEMKSITACSLYFSATWFVTTVIISGILIMVLGANFIAIKYLKQFSYLLYLPLFISVIIIYVVPSNSILALSFFGRIAWTLFAVPLPIFFAGLIFSTTFRKIKNPSASLGANLIGATIGGLLEYHGMAVGHNNLTFYILAAYFASLMLVLFKKNWYLN